MADDSAGLRYSDSYRPQQQYRHNGRYQPGPDGSAQNWDRPEHGYDYRHPHHHHSNGPPPPAWQHHHQGDPAAHPHEAYDDRHYRQRRDDRPLYPERRYNDDRYREDYDTRRSMPDDRVPPPRRERDDHYQSDSYYNRERGYGEGSSRAQPSYDNGLIRFASPVQDPPQRHHYEQEYRSSDRQYRDDSDYKRDSPYAHSNHHRSDLPDRPRRQPRTAPNQSVILIGIPPMCDGDDVRSFIDEFKPNPSDPSPVEDVTIVMDKQTGQSKRFGFVRFITLEHARAFVEANYDHVFWKSRGSHDIVEDGVKIRIDYASDDRRPGEPRPRKRDFDKVERVERAPVNMNDGSKDIGSTPNNILLLRNLDPLTNEVHLATKLENLDDAARERTLQARGPKRIILIKDRESNASWCFAFAIFPDVECSKAALRSILDPATFPQGFTIQDKLAAVTFARNGCFIKAYAKTTWSFPDEGDDGKKQEYLYWDDAAYGLLYDSPAYKDAIARKEAEEPKADDVDAFLNSLAGEGGISQSEGDMVNPPPAINLSLAGTLGPAVHSAKEKKKPTELIVSKKIAVDINKWNQKKAEVTAPETAAAIVPAQLVQPTIKAESSQPNPVTPAATSPLSSLDTEGLDFADLSDINVPKCLLCQRQFKSLEVLQKHSKQSDLHKNNLKDESKVAAATEAISKIPASSTASGAVSQYRDRALERRTALGQPEHPPPPKRQKMALAVEKSQPVVSAPEKEIEDSNIGSKLLASMGWTSGSGLGSSAAGRAAPVQAKAFASGAGIGASQGVNATEKANESWGGKDFGRMKAAQRMAESQKRQ